MLPSSKSFVTELRLIERKVCIDYGMHLANRSLSLLSSPKLTIRHPYTR